MESNALKKSTNKSFEVFYANYYDSTDCPSLQCCGSISPKTILILSKNFLNFWFNAIEKQSIIDLSRYGSKSYASVVLGVSKVTFLRNGEDSAFCLSPYCLLVIYEYKCSLLSIFLLSSGYIQT